SLEHPYKGVGLVPPGQLPECAEIVLPIHRRNNDLGLAGSDKFGVHHDPCQPAVAVQEGMHLADDEHHVGGLCKRIVQCAVKIKPTYECTPDERMVYKFGIARTVVPVLELAGVLCRSCGHQYP